MKDYLWKVRTVFSSAFLAVLVSLCGVALGAEGVPTFRVTKGTAMLKRGETVMQLLPGASPSSLVAGDVMTTAKKCTARVSLEGKNVVDLEEDTSVVLKAFGIDPEKRVVTLVLLLERGTVRPAIYEPAKPELGKKEMMPTGLGPKEKPLTYDLHVLIGKAEVEGTSLVGKIVRLGEGKYTVDISAGRPVLWHGKLVVRLGSGVTVDEGPPLTVTALETNKVPVAVAYIGGVVMVLQPGQSVSIEEMDDSVLITNLSKEDPLFVSGWEEASLTTIEPGGSAVFKLVAVEIGRERVLSYIAQILELFRGVAPGLFPPEVAAPPGVVPPIEIIEQTGREDQGGEQSASE